jgi:hypothetical protein
MAYKLLGITVWKGAKWFLRRKYGSAMAPKPLLAGGLLALILAIVLATRQRTTGD